MYEYLVSVLSVLVWGAFCVGWEPITYYWVVALFPDSSLWAFSCAGDRWRSTSSWRHL